MRKFTIHSKKGKTAIMEVECEIIRPIEDPSVLWELKPGEYRARITAPPSFHQRVEKTVEGKKEIVMVPDVWCWHAFHDTVEEALDASIKTIRDGFAFNERKYGTAYTEEDVQASVKEIEVVML